MLRSRKDACHPAEGRQVPSRLSNALRERGQGDIAVMIPKGAALIARPLLTERALYKRAELCRFADSGQEATPQSPPVLLPSKKLHAQQTTQKRPGVGSAGVLSQWDLPSDASASRTLPFHGVNNRRSKTQGVTTQVLEAGAVNV